MRSNETPQAKLQKAIYFVRKGYYPVKTAVVFWGKDGFYEMGGRKFTKSGVAQWIKTHPTLDQSSHIVWEEIKSYE